MTKPKLDEQAMSTELGAVASFALSHQQAGKLESPQTVKPASPRDGKPESGLEGKPASRQDDNPAKPQAGMSAGPQAREAARQQTRSTASRQTHKQASGFVEKYTTRLLPGTIKAIKRLALESDRKDYEVVEEAINRYLAYAGKEGE